MPLKNKNNLKSIAIQYYIDKYFIGWVLMAATSKGICWVEMGDSKEKLLKNFQKNFKDQDFEKVSKTKNKYFQKLANHLEGKSKWSKIKYDVPGTSFKKQVWKFMQTIPEGKVLYYSDIAQKIGKPGAFRAVASACATNPVPLVVPCHRVVPKSGGIGKFGPGVAKKKALLKREGYLNIQ